jgi:hypothetical protein
MKNERRTNVRDGLFQISNLLPTNCTIVINYRGGPQVWKI